jgi:hypothetical protein
LKERKKERKGGREEGRKTKAPSPGRISLFCAEVPLLFDFLHAGRCRLPGVQRRINVRDVLLIG